MYEGIVTERAQRDEREEKKTAKRVAQRVDDQHINYIGKRIPNIIN